MPTVIPGIRVERQISYHCKDRINVLAATRYEESTNRPDVSLKKRGRAESGIGSDVKG